MDAEAFRGLIESETGGTVTGIARAAVGASRATWLVDVSRGEEILALVLRVDTGDGPLSGTRLDLAREAGVYAALRATPVRLPRLLAVAPEGRALLVERAPGSEAFASIADPDDRQRLVRDYFSALATLHRVEAGELDLPGIDAPASRREAALPDLRLWREIHGARAGDPLFVFALDWLESHAPEAERIALCHGDAGPGNFLFEGDRVSALLDWEFAHLGDPLDDLAWVAVRAQLLGGFGDLADGACVWARETGLTIDLARIEFYRALVLTRMGISCLAALEHAGLREMDTTVYELLLPYLRSLLPESLARLGCDDPRRETFAAAGAAAVDASPVLRAMARPLDLLELR